MSLLIKALKKAQLDQPADTGATSEPGPGAGEGTITAPRAERVRFQVAPTRRSWLLPATAGLAVLAAVAWGTYAYLLKATPPLGRPSPARPADSAPFPATLPAPRAPAPAPPGPAHEAPAEQAIQPPPEPRHLHGDAPGTAGADRGVPPQPPAGNNSAAREPIIRITAGGAPATVDPTLSEAYRALRQGRFEAARTLYRRLIETRPDNVDALLGLAAIAAREGRNKQAGAYYLRILRLDPHNPVAQAGLVGLVGRADPESGESRLKQLLERRPAAFLFFALGNLYAVQSRWPAAEAAYFQAWRMDGGNPDYAFNLAVSLDHLGQRKAALSYYRRARRLARKEGSAGFDPALASARIARLGGAVEGEK